MEPLLQRSGRQVPHTEDGAETEDRYWLEVLGHELAPRVAAGHDLGCQAVGDRLDEAVDAVIHVSRAIPAVQAAPLVQMPLAVDRED